MKIFSGLNTCAESCKTHKIPVLPSCLKGRVWVVSTQVRTKMKTNPKYFLQNSLCNLSVVFPVLSANINGLLTQRSALLKISFLKVHSWRDKRKEVYIEHLEVLLRFLLLRFAFKSVLLIFLQADVVVVSTVAGTPTNHKVWLGRIFYHPRSTQMCEAVICFLKCTCLIRYIGHVGGVMFDCFFIMFQRRFKVLILICSIPKFFFL